MNDPQAILPVIDSLVTTHKEAVPPNGGSGIGATFGSGSPGSFNFGGKAKVVAREFSNDGVLYGLKAITGEDHRFEKETWRRWYIRANTPKNVQLRRDD